MQNPWKMPDYYGLMISSNKHTILFGNGYIMITFIVARLQ